MRRLDKVFLGHRQRLAKVDRLAGSLFSIAVVPERGVRVGQSGIGQGKFRVLFSRGLESRNRVQVPAVSQELDTLVVIS